MQLVNERDVLCKPNGRVESFVTMGDSSLHIKNFTVNSAQWTNTKNTYV